MRSKTIYFAVGILFFVCFARDLNAEGIVKEQSIRFIQFSVVYDFVSKSEIKNPKLIKIKHVKVFKKNGRSMFYIGVINKDKQPISLFGTVTFFDKSGNIIYKQGKGIKDVASEDEYEREMSEFFGQATPGFSEGVDMEQGFESVDINKINKVKIVIHNAFIDTADRD